MPQFTFENARLNAAKSIEARRLNAIQREEDRLIVAKIRAQALLDAIPRPDFAANRLMRVQKQLDTLDDLLEEAITEGESRRVKELTDAQMRLAEQERILAGRPLPGSKRPSAKSEKPRSSYAPVVGDHPNETAGE